MIATVHTATLLGVEALPIEVEAQLSQGLPVFSIVGLGDRAINEARYRITCAMRTIGLELPRKRVTINLAPAGVKKDGAALDLPMALGMLLAAEVLESAALDGTLAVGELALSGALRPIRGALAVASLARKAGFRRIIVPRENGPEAALVRGIEVLAPRSLSDLLAFYRGDAAAPHPDASVPAEVHSEAPDLRDVRGQAEARRALEIAAAGAHNLLLVGPPGSGKTMLARRISSILPPLTTDEQIEVTQIWSAAGLTLCGGRVSDKPPFRAPHYSISGAGLVGGGPSIRPGEVSLAHRGVLFLDELPELQRHVLESLRQPLEDRHVVVARARHVLHLPASFILIGAANPCPCGWLGDPSGRCRCAPELIHRYASRISGPLIDRIDLVSEAPMLDPDEMMSDQPAECSNEVQSRVLVARERMRARGCRANADLSGQNLRQHARLASGAARLLREAMTSFRLSARTLDRTLRVARTIADLAEAVVVDEEAIGEALQYRRASAWQTAGTA